MSDGITPGSSSGQSVMSYAGGEGVIKIRLDTTRLVNDMELFLKGLKTSLLFNTETQQTEMITTKVGEPLMNDKGIQCVLMTVNQIVNSQGVQGNWSQDYFKQFVCEVDITFSKNLWVNLKKWDVSLSNYNVICDAFTGLVQEYASRIIDNRERESYGMSMKTTESVVQNQRGGIGGLFSGGG
jgi:hypothetical protein